jgi:glycosyltransferase involved in cell wall biosynthesis
MRICFISHTAWDQGGAEKSLLDLIDVIHSDKIVCSVILPSKGPLCAELEKRRLRWSVLPFKRWNGKRSSHVGLLWAIMVNCSMLLPLIMLFKRWKIDLVCSNTVTVGIGAFACAILRMPHIWYLQEIPETRSRWHFDLGFERSMRIIDSLSSACIVNSRAVEEYYKKFIRPEKMQHIYYGFRENERALLAPVDLPGLRSDSVLTCVIVGTINDPKGQFDAIRAVEYLAQKGIVVSLFIVGRGREEYLVELKNFIDLKNLERQVFFFGYQENPLPYYKHADIALMCSKKEAFGRVTVEAMMSGKPVIGTRAGGTLDILREGENGFFYTPGNFIELSEKINFFCDQPEAASAMGLKARQFAKESFSMEKYKAGFLQVVKKIGVE